MITMTRGDSDSEHFNRTLLRRFDVPAFGPSSCTLHSAEQGINIGDGLHIPCKSVLTSLAASTFAGLSKLGVSDERSEITLTSCKKSVIGWGRRMKNNIQWTRLCEQATTFQQRPRIRIHPRRVHASGDIIAGQNRT